MEKTIKKITFKNIADFRARFAALWQNQKENETYEFVFLDQETEDEFKKIQMCFECKSDLKGLYE